MLKSPRTQVLSSKARTVAVVLSFLGLVEWIAHASDHGPWSDARVPIGVRSAVRRDYDVAFLPEETVPPPGSRFQAALEDQIWQPWTRGLSIQVRRSVDGKRLEFRPLDRADPPTAVGADPSVSRRPLPAERVFNTQHQQNHSLGRPIPLVVPPRQPQHSQRGGLVRPVGREKSSSSPEGDGFRPSEASPSDESRAFSPRCGRLSFSGREVRCVDPVGVARARTSSSGVELQSFSVAPEQQSQSPEPRGRFFFSRRMSTHPSLVPFSTRTGVCTRTGVSFSTRRHADADGGKHVALCAAPGAASSDAAPGAAQSAISRERSPTRHSGPVRDGGDESATILSENTLQRPLSKSIGFSAGTTMWSGFKHVKCGNNAEGCNVVMREGCNVVMREGNSLGRMQRCYARRGVNVLRRDVVPTSCDTNVLTSWRRELT